MNNRALYILTGMLLCIAVLFCGLWLQARTDLSEMEDLCKTSAYAAKDAFLDYYKGGSSGSYWTAVGEYRAFMRGYHVLVEAGIGDHTSYLYCNDLYGAMCIQSEKVMPYGYKLYECMAWLSQDPYDEDAFYQIQWINNQIKHG